MTMRKELSTTDKSEKPEKSSAPPIHPTLFALFPILALYAQNVEEVGWRQLLKPLAIALVGTFVVWLIATLATKNLWKGALIASLLSLPYFSYSHVFDLMPSANRWAIIPIFIAIVVPLFFMIVRAKGKLKEATLALNFASTVLLLPSLWTVAVNSWQLSQIKPKPPLVRSSQLRKDTSHPSAKRKTYLGVKSSQSSPDIYYLILDAYGRQDSLKTFFGFDNSIFIKELQNRGFYVAAKSRANYNQTTLCIASSLNFTYLDEVTTENSPAAGLEACRQMLDDNEVAAYLSGKGYRYVSIGCGVGQTRVDTADVSLNPTTPVPEFEDLAVDMTIPGPLRRAAFQNKRYDQHRNNLRGVFDNLDVIAQQPYTKFVFAHVLAPHPPFVFGPNGEAVYPNTPFTFSDASALLKLISPEQYKAGYISQLKYVNHRTLQAIDAILKQSKTRPVIIIQGDHGSRFSLDWESLEKTDLREPFSIFNSYLVPSQARAHLYDKITPVNTFPVLLNSIFGANFKLQPDRSFYSTAEEPLDFTDVTAQINEPTTPSNR